MKADDARQQHECSARPGSAADSDPAPAPRGAGAAETSTAPSHSRTPSALALETLGDAGRRARKVCLSWADGKGFSDLEFQWRTGGLNYALHLGLPWLGVSGPAHSPVANRFTGLCGVC